MEPSTPVIDEPDPESVKEYLLREAARLAPDQICVQVLTEYWRYVPAEELTARTPVDLMTAVSSHRNLAAERPAGQLRLRVHTPDPDHERWVAGHTVIELVTDDMSFLVDSVTAELARHGLTVHLLVHPQVVVRRDASGALQDVVCDVVPDEAPTGSLVESWMHVEVDRTRDSGALERIRSGLTEVLTDVREAVEDWQTMRERALALADALVTADLPVPHKDVSDARDLLRWLVDDHFAFLGYREYELVGRPGYEELRSRAGSGLGILRHDKPFGRSLAAMPADVRAKALEKRLLVITKANSRSTVHRPAYLDYIGFKTFDEHGNVIGEQRFLGLFSSEAYLESVRNLPVVRRKVEDVMARSRLTPHSHSGKGLLAILETYPRDELFQITTGELYGTCMQVLRLSGRRDLRAFLHRDAYARFVSCLVYLPRDRYTTQNRLRMQQILLTELHGIGVDYTTRVTESTLARVHFIVRTDPTRPVGPLDAEMQAKVQAELATATRSWSDDLVTAISSELGEEQTRTLSRRYGEGFPEGYKEDHTPTQAIDDISRMEMLDEPGEITFTLYRPRPEELRATIYRAGQQLSLSDVLPVLVSLGVSVIDERPYRVERADLTADVATVHIYDFGLRAVHGVGPVEQIVGLVANAFSAAWRGECEVDGFNALVLSAGLTWQQVAVLRAYARYLRQTGTIYSQEYIESTLAEFPQLASLLVELFAARFNPAQPDAERRIRQEQVSFELVTGLDAVASLDQDRIIRSFLALIGATLRTNRYQRGRDGRGKPYLAIKIDSDAVPELPSPRPHVEIFVYSPRVEGVHLRFGAVARGGLRWSDRREDFRTEVLGLVKAQEVKNSVIVPVGAKGGFVVKRPPVAADPAAQREQLQAEGVACYRTFVSGLLDITDNMVDGQVVPPAEVVRHDGDDAYLVVAADKGTATFSDIANEVAASYGFWLGDAFASGGSAGYDHKRMGITARGAWESVKRHFRELGVDTQSQDFTVVGVGDMSGDVFGNGMLLSEHIRLVAAFDHRHVFVDPDPDPKTSFAERERLFALSRSSWADYDRALISRGGGVWPRTVKSIPVSAEMRRCIGLTAEVESMAPAELIRAVLLAPVDLLWNGGIGTYVKASDEAHGDAGDKANDPVRVDGRQLRCRVVGEGGNLGLTQRGRIEYALAGGQINTDAIDNSAGVDTSDHEVNIKILLGGVADLDRPARDALLERMTGEIAEHVLRDNYEQNIALGTARRQAASMFGVHVRLLAELERAGRLDRAIEFLPGDEEIARRTETGIGLTSPELAVVLAYVKIRLEETLLASDLPDEPWCDTVLADYFPTPLREEYAAAMAQHPLRREIITTVVANEVVNRCGTSFLFRATEETGADVVDVVRAFLVVREVYGLPEVWAKVESLDAVVSTDAQVGVLLEGRRLIDRAVRWLVQGRRGPIDVVGEIERLRPGVSALLPDMEQLYCGRECEALRNHAVALVAAGVPDELAQLVTRTLYGFGLLDIVEVAGRLSVPPREVAEVYYNVSEQFRVDTLLEQISGLSRKDRWNALARMALRYDLYAALAELTAEVLQSTSPGEPGADRVAAWQRTNASSIARAQNNLREFAKEGKSDLAVLSVLLRQIRTMVRASAAG
jgi:glutamate dehydrogenase